VSRCTLVLGSCEAVLRDLPACSVDAVVTDPPAGIGFMGRAWDSDKGGRDQWIAWLAGIMRECLRVLRPGGHALVWALPRTSHWTATAVEDAGFEIRDVHHHIFGQGMPKSLDMERQFDMHFCTRAGRHIDKTLPRGAKSRPGDHLCPPSNRRWLGRNMRTALKPAVEHWILARRPLEGTYAANVLKHGTGALNVDACRIGHDEKIEWRAGRKSSGGIMNATDEARDPFEQHQLGRWPAHLSLDEDAARLLDEQSGERKSGEYPANRKGIGFKDGAYGTQNSGTTGDRRVANAGGASRFFYVAKGSRREKDAGLEDLPAATGGEATGRTDGAAGTRNPRAGAGRTGGARNTHPTVKAVALMRWLVRLITPPGGLVLDPFAGSGTTGIACAEEGMRFVGVEQDEKHHEIARLRLRKAYGAVATELPAQGALAAVLTAQPRAS
jgi:DNA modification methylase